MIFSILFSFFFLTGFSNHPEPMDRWIVELQPQGGKCLREWWAAREFQSPAFLMKELPVDNWVVIQIPKHHSAEIERLPCVRNLYIDHKIKWRNTAPNDPGYVNQENLDLIGMEKAWDVSQGGLTTRGDTIVIALIDDGFQLDHEDLQANIWVNRDEIPNDASDNDNNGYEDDYYGLNITTGTDDHPNLDHGTSVIGIAGARGNNSKGIAGVNWRVKLMLISGADFTSDIIEAYDYILDMRKRYRLTNGEKGAFIVATNLSGGIDLAFGEDHPLWCGMYDKLGDEGILSVSAVTNLNYDVDELGDMPTTCSSSFLITVADVDLTDTHLGGFGAESVDLAAPGHGSISTGKTNAYKVFDGTSASAPHVSGTIALMYSTPCTFFLDGIDSDPKSIAEKVRDILFATGDENNSLEDITATGKRLQTDAAMWETVQGACDTTSIEEVHIISVSPNPPEENEVRAFFEIRGDTSTAYFELYTSTGALINHYPLTQVEWTQGYLRVNTQPLPAGIYFLTIHNKKARDTAKIFVY